MNSSSSRKAKLRISKPILIANCFSKCHLKHLGKRDGKNEIPFIKGTDKNGGVYNTPTIIREYSNIEKCMSIVSERINKKNNRLYREVMVSIVKFEQSAFEYERLHGSLKDKLKEYDIVNPVSYSLPEEENMLNSKRQSEENLDPFGVRLRRFNEYQSKLNPMRKRLIESRTNLMKQYQEIVVDIKQLKLLDTYIDTSFIYYSARVSKRISWYWQGVLNKHPEKKALLQFPSLPQDSKLRIIHQNRRQEVEDRLKILEQIHENVLRLPEL